MSQGNKGGTTDRKKGVKRRVKRVVQKGVKRWSQKKGLKKVKMGLRKMWQKK